MAFVVDETLLRHRFAQTGRNGFNAIGVSTKSECATRAVECSEISGIGDDAVLTTDRREPEKCRGYCQESYHSDEYANVLFGHAPLFRPLEFEFSVHESFEFRVRGHLRHGAFVSCVRIRLSDNRYRRGLYLGRRRGLYIRERFRRQHNRHRWLGWS